MSEFQYYEFRAIDKPLSAEARKEISSWSSRTTASSTSATFTYSYSDFPKDELTVVEQYFDAMFYTANWGTKRLIFKFPLDLVDVRQMGQYSVEGLEVLKKPNAILLDITINDEDGGGWIEGEEHLSSLITLREDIMAGDYRCLYLIWLKVSVEDVMNEWSDIVDPDSEEPAVPAGLQSLSGVLAEFAQTFDITEDMIAVAAEKSPRLSSDKDEDYAQEIAKLSDDEKTDFLKRLLKNEPLLSNALKNRLISMTDRKTIDKQQERRTVEALAQAVQTLENRKKKAHKEAQERAQQEKIDSLAQKESQLWQEVDTLIGEKNAKAYREAISVLQDLKSLAIAKDRYLAFSQRIETIKQNNSRLSSFKRSLDLANLVETKQ